MVTENVDNTKMKTFWFLERKWWQYYLLEALFKLKRYLCGPTVNCLYISCTDKKEKEIFLKYKEIQKWSVAKSFMRKSFPSIQYEEMRKYLTIYEEAVSHMWLCNRSLLNLLYMRKIQFSFLSVWHSFFNRMSERPVPHSSRKTHKLAPVFLLLLRPNNIQY